MPRWLDGTTGVSFVEVCDGRTDSLALKAHAVARLPAAVADASTRLAVEQPCAFAYYAPLRVTFKRPVELIKSLRILTELADQYSHVTRLRDG